MRVNDAERVRGDVTHRGVEASVESPRLCCPCGPCRCLVCEDRKCVWAKHLDSRRMVHSRKCTWKSPSSRNFIFSHYPAHAALLQCTKRADVGVIYVWPPWKPFCSFIRRGCSVVMANEI